MSTDDTERAIRDLSERIAVQSEIWEALIARRQACFKALAAAGDDFESVYAAAERAELEEEAAAQELKRLFAVLDGIKRHS